MKRILKIIAFVLILPLDFVGSFLFESGKFAVGYIRDVPYMWDYWVNIKKFKAPKIFRSSD